MRILPPSCRFPPRAGRTKQRFPLRSRGNLTEGVFKKCRAMSLIKGGESAVNPPSPQPSPPLSKGERVQGVGGSNTHCRS
jgi:hypothetical protein